MTPTGYVKERIEYYEYFKKYYSTKTDQIIIPCAPSAKDIEEKIVIYTTILSILEDRNAGQWK